MTAKKFHQVGLIGSAARAGVGDVLPQLHQLLTEAGAKVVLSESLAGTLQKAAALPLQELVQQIDWAIIVGGDGSLLSVAWPLAEAGVPVTGINLGRVGFLADIAPRDIGENITCVLRGEYLEQQRILLSARVGRSPQPCARALNEFLLHSPEAVSLSDFRLQAGQQQLYSIRADGIIVSTPTGSTAYSLSAGGPILAPGLAGMSVVPMLAHSTGYGSVVLPMATQLTAVAKQPTRLTADGEAVAAVEPGQSVTIGPEARPLRQLHPCDYDFFATVRSKLGWGALPVDKREEDRQTGGGQITP